MKWFVTLCLISLLVVGAGLRWYFVQHISPDVDELTTLWATRRILDTGMPLMPSGVLYTRGILHSYTIGAFACIGGLTTTVGRLPSVLFGLLSILLIGWIGRQAWHERVGLLAAAGLAFLPEAVLADGHARFYAQHLFFTLLTLWLTYRALDLPAQPGDDHRPSWGLHLAATLAFGLALFAQEETVLLYPTLVLAIYLWRGWRYLWQPPVLVAQGLALGLLLLRYALEQLGQPGYFAAIQTHKAYLNFDFDFVGAWHTYRSLYIAPPRLGWTAMALVGVSVALVALWQQRKTQWRLAHLPAAQQAVLFFALPFFLIFGILLTLVGEQWRNERYLLFLQPCWLLVGAAGVHWLVERWFQQPRWRASATLLIAGTLLIPLWPSLRAGLLNHPEGYAAAFTYVAAHRQAGDIIITPQPPACAAILGEPCTFYARERGYEPYVTVQNGVVVDRWSGAPLLNTVAQLQHVLKTAKAQGVRVWFVTDGNRLGKRYNEAFMQTTIEQFHLAFEVRGVRVLQAAGWQTLPPYIIQKTFTPPLAVGAMTIARWERTSAQPGAAVHVQLHWGHIGLLQAQINTSVQVAAADGTRLTQADGPPALGIISTFEEVRGTLPDLKTLRLPANLQPGRYRFEIVAYDAQTRTPLAAPLAIDWFTVGAPPVKPVYTLNAQWQNGLRLLGGDAWPAILAPNTPLPLRLVWSTTTAIKHDYTVFIHLLGPDGQIIAQHDSQPAAGFYPTSGWLVDEPIEDHYTLALPATLPPGDYRLIVGWYQPTTMVRLALVNGNDRIAITHWRLP